MATNSVHYLPHHRIDKNKWDQCVGNCTNSLIYAKSFFLDEVSPAWDALIFGDYQTVMPLTWKKKYGFYYLFQPFFIPALGLFGNELTPEDVRQFLTAIPKKFKFWDIDLNEANRIDATVAGGDWKFTQRKNQMLLLNDSAKTLEGNFKRLACRMIHRAEQELAVTSISDAAEVIDFCETIYEKTHRVPRSAYDNLRRALYIAQQQGLSHAYLARGKDGTIIGAYLVLADRHFVYSLIGGTNDIGKKAGAFYLLTATVLRQFAESKRTFRFEGSDIPGIAFFNSQFMASPQTYYHLKCNRLPFPFRFIKK